MHNFNLTSIPTEQQRITNTNIIEESLNNNSYSYWISSTDLYDDGSANNASFSAGSLTVPSCWVLVDGVTSGVGFYIKRHNDWKYGSFDIKPHWSSSKAGDLSMIVKVDTFSEGSSASAGSSVGYTLTVGSVDVINTSLMMSATTRADSLVDRSKIGLYFHLQRDGAAAADTSAGDMSIYGIELIYNEVKRVIGDVIKK